MKKKKEHKHSQAAKTNPTKAVLVAEPAHWKYQSILFVILLLTFIAYLPALQNGFVWDDEPYITKNPLIYSFNLKEIFSQYVLGNYHPFTMLTLATEYHFFGLNATGYHSVNLLIHLLNVILVFYSVFFLSDKSGVALAAALLFGIHPLHVESVAWAAELKDLLYTFFFLASFICYLKYIKGFKKKYYVFALVLFSISLLSKAMAASLPVVLVLTDYFKGRKINIKSLLEKAPFFLLALIFGVVAIFAQKSSDAIQDMAVFSFPQKLTFACYGFITYLYKLLSAQNLCVLYPYPIKNGADIPLQYYAYVILFLGLASAVFYSLLYSKKVIYGIGFFTATVFLVLQLLPVGGAIMADRYS
ncbi:MAG: glycosyltransferase family 39 protein, partial [Bacteroidia bacterium]|nr:glycosyltransferase family 39 protein [Bacteroidia bacterium]